MTFSMLRKMSLLGSKRVRMFIAASLESYAASAADVDGPVVAIGWVEAQKFEIRLAGSDTGVEEDGGHMKLAHQLALDGADAKEGVQGFQIGDQHDGVAFAF